MQQQGGQNREPRANGQDFTQLTAGGTPVVGEFNANDVIGGDYRVIQWIGAGGMGNVYRVVHTMMGTEYALKTLSADKVTEVAWRRFQNEAQAIARMDHPNVVKIYNLGLHEGRLPFYVMDILRGDTMLDYLRDQGPMPLPMAMDLFSEICSGLGYAHKKGIVHRDVKPPNIVLLNSPDTGAKVKIVDFGIAKLSGVKDPANQFLTNVGEVCGSPYYMSPEQTAGQRIDARSDIYSLGCTLFEMLTGKPPIRGSSAVETMMMHQTTSAPTLKEATGGQEFPEMLEQLMATMLAKAPMDRYQTMELVAQDLAVIKGGQQAQISPFAPSNLNLDSTPFSATTSSGMSLAQTSSSMRRQRNTSLFEEIPEAEKQLEEKEEDGNGNLVKIVALGFATLLLCGAAGGYFWYSNHKPAAPVTAKPSANAAMGPRDIGLLSKISPEATGNLADGQEDVPFDAKPTKSLKDTGFFSSIVQSRGHQARVFKFPTDFVLGSIGIMMEGLVDAQGELEFSVKEKLKFKPNPLLANYPQYFKRFRPGEITAIALEGGKGDSQLVIAEQLKHVVDMQGLSEVRFEGLKTLTPDMVRLLARVSALDELHCKGKDFKAESMLQVKNLRKLKAVGCDTEKSVELLLEGLKGDSTIERLYLSNAPITVKDMEICASMPKMSNLSVELCKMDDATFRKMTDLKLSGLILEGTPLNVSKIMALRQMHLQGLSVSARDFVGVTKESVLRALQGTQVEVNHDFSGSVYIAPTTQ